MNKTINALLLFLCLALTWACGDSDNDNPYATVHSISVENMDIFFSPSAATGTINVSAPEAVQAKSSASWCKVQGVAGNTITLQADANNSLEGRTAIISIYTPNDSISVTAQQDGLVFTIVASDIMANDDAGSQTFDLQHNVDNGVDVTSSADWLRWAIDGDNFIVSYDANNSGHKRTAYIYYTVAGFKDSIMVQQVEFAKDFGGTYKIRSSNAAVDGMNFTLSEDKLVFDDYDQTIAGTFDLSAGTFTARYGQKTGTPAKFISQSPHLSSSFSSYNINLEVLTGTTNSGWHWPNSSDHTFGANTGTLIITFDYDEASGKHIGTLSGKYNGKNIDGLRFGVFDNTQSPFLYHGTALNFPNAHFEK